MTYQSLDKKGLLAEKAAVASEYEGYKDMGLMLDLSRGKPSAEQLDLSLGLLSRQRTVADCRAKDGTDCRNYGLAFGIPEMKKIFSDLTGIDYDNIIVGGNSSLNMMYDTMARAMLYGVCDSARPWCREEKIRFLCPSPGYDRHFAICESMGIEMLTIKMTDKGPDMDAVEEAVKDPSVKGIWCVPKYSNPTGITYADEVVTRLARMQTAAPDFRIFWDNAYVVHDLYDESDTLLDIFEEAKRYGNENRVFYFTSTSKVTFPGSGVAMMAASEENLRQIKPIIMVQTIGPDKMNQLRHVEFLRDRDGFLLQMKKHADIMREKFEIVLAALSELDGLGIAEWTRPRGGYFISFDALPHTAKRIYELCKAAGVTLTTVGATFPYGIDPEDRNLRLAPSFPNNADLAMAAKVFVCAVKLASIEALLLKA